jgi:chlorobactene glucosyltransferase
MEWPELRLHRDSAIMRRLDRAPYARHLVASVLGIARAASWLLVLNCLQNLLLAPRARNIRTDPRRQHGGESCPLVSILVPARDEAANIAACLRGLLAQNYPTTEVIVCDDSSTDETAAIVRALAARPGNEQLRLLTGLPRPAGWSGKNWTCHQLAQAARGGWLLFTDADTRHGPASVGAALALAWQYQADLVSLLPRHEARTLGERLLVTQLPLIAWSLLPIALVPRRAAFARPFAGANGLYLFFRRDWYITLGGYRAVRGAIAEDMRFAVETKRRGGILVLADGSAVVTCRMYDGFASAWRGLARNALPAALDSPPIFLAFASIWTILFVLPPLTVLARTSRRAMARGSGSGKSTWFPSGLRDQKSCRIGGLAWGATTGQVVLRWLIGRRFARPAWEAGLQPLSSVLLLGVLFDSYRRHRLGGRIVWRERKYASRG